jgi:uncharacterized membrane protein YfcA
MNEAMFLRIFSVVVVALAGYVRGYGGFGFSMITVAALSLVMPPERIVPVVLILEVGASSFLLPGAWPSVDWRVLWRMLVGVVAGIPLGVWLLGSVPPAPMKMALALIIFTLALLLRQGIVLKRQPGCPAIAAVGVTSGILNGAAAIGGPPAVLFFFSSPVGAAISRASLIAYFLVTDILAAGTCAVAGIMSIDHVREALILSIPMIAGLSFGKRAFTQTSEDRFRRRVLLYLMFLSLLTLVRAMVQLPA